MRRQELLFVEQTLEHARVPSLVNQSEGAVGPIESAGRDQSGRLFRPVLLQPQQTVGKVGQFPVGPLGGDGHGQQGDESHHGPHGQLLVTGPVLRHERVVEEAVGLTPQ